MQWDYCGKTGNYNVITSSSDASATFLDYLEAKNYSQNV